MTERSTPEVSVVTLEQWYVPVVYCLVLVLPTIIWISLDRSIWSFDQSFYGISAIRFWTTLTSSDPLTYFHLFLQSCPGAKAPGIALIGQYFVPLGNWIGACSIALLASIVLQAFVSLIFVFSTARHLEPNNRYAPYLVSLLLASGPLFIYLSRDFLVEMMQLMSVAYFYWILASYQKRKVSYNLVHTLVATATALLAKVSSPVYCLIPGMVLAFRIVRDSITTGLSSFRSVKLAVCLTVALFLFCITVIWYLSNFSVAFGTAQQLSIGQIAENYGTRAGVLEKLFIWVGKLTDHSLATPFLWLLVVYPLIHLLKSAKAGFPKLSQVRVFDFTALLALLQIILVFTILSNTIPEDVRYIFALYPSILIVLQYAFLKVKSKSYYVLCAVVLVLQFSIINLVSYGVVPKFFKANSEFKTVKKETYIEEEINSIVDLSWQYSKRGYDIVIGANYPSFNANSLSYYAACRYENTSSMTLFENWNLRADADQVIALLNKKPKYLFISFDPATLQQRNELPHANRLNLVVLKHVSTHGKQLNFKSRNHVVIYKVDSAESSK